MLENIFLQVLIPKESGSIYTRYCTNTKLHTVLVSENL